MSAPTVGDAGIDSPPADLTWLLHRAAQRMRTALDQVAQASGLAGVRDWIVLAALTAEPGRTQLALAHDLGLDKTTLTSLLDRLEAGGLVVRSVDPHDRRLAAGQVQAACYCHDGGQGDHSVALGSAQSCSCAASERHCLSKQSRLDRSAFIACQGLVMAGILRAKR